MSSDHDPHEINNISTAGASQPLRRNVGKGMEQARLFFVIWNLYPTLNSIHGSVGFHIDHRGILF
jgi:hypothetical protein